MHGLLINLDEVYLKKEITFDEVVLKDNELDKRILDLNARVSGRVYVNLTEEIILECTFFGEMYIEDSITLLSVPYKFAIDISEDLDEMKKNYIDFFQKNKNILDLKQILWQNIVLEVPISYTESKDAQIKGNGWELINEKKTSEIDPRLEKLKDLLKGDD